MNNKTFWIGFVAVFIVMQAIGYLIHGGDDGGDL